jgi:hypothetical protein
MRRKELLEILEKSGGSHEKLLVSGWHNLVSCKA